MSINKCASLHQSQIIRPDLDDQNRSPVTMSILEVRVNVLSAKNNPSH
jgi:hypothetical protein